MSGHHGLTLRRHQTRLLWDRSPVPGGKEAQNGQGVVVTGSTVDTDGASSSGTRDTQSLTDIQYIILDCSTMSYVDSMGVKVLRQVGDIGDLVNTSTIKFGGGGGRGELMIHLLLKALFQLVECLQNVTNILHIIYMCTQPLLRYISHTVELGNNDNSRSFLKVSL